MDDRAVEKMYQANIKLVDENTLLRNYKKELERKIDKAIEHMSNYILNDGDSNAKIELMKIIDIFKGDCYEQDNSEWENM